MKEKKIVLLYTLISYMAIFGMALSSIFINGIHLFIIGCNIIAIWIINASVILYLVIRDQYRIYEKNKQKRSKK